MLNLGNILTVHGYRQVVGKPGTYADPDRYQSRDPNAMYTFFADMQGESEARRQNSKGKVGHWFS